MPSNAMFLTVPKSKLLLLAGSQPTTAKTSKYQNFYTVSKHKMPFMGHLVYKFKPSQAS